MIEEEQIRKWLSGEDLEGLDERALLKELIIQVRAINENLRDQKNFRAPAWLRAAFDP